MRSRLQARISYASQLFSSETSGSALDFGSTPTAPTAMTWIMLFRLRRNTSGGIAAYLWSRANATAGPKAIINVEPQSNGGTLTWGGSSTGLAGKPESYFRLPGFNALIGRWVWLGGTWDGTTASTGITAFFAYENNVLSRIIRAAGTSGLTAGSGFAAGSLTIGSRWDGTSYTFAPIGDVAMFAQWDGVLSTGDILKAQALGPQAVPTNLIINVMNSRDYGPNAYAVTLNKVSRAEVVWTPPPRHPGFVLVDLMGQASL